MGIDVIHQGEAYGSVAKAMLRNNFNTGALRPWEGKDGRSYITVNNGYGKTVNKLVANDTATLRFQDWRLIDEAVLRVAKARLVAVAAVRAAGLQVTIPDGLSVTVYSHERVSDITEANIAMNPITRGQSDRPVFDILNLPMPVMFKDVDINIRELMASRRGGSPIDTTSIELAARRVAEMAEQLLLGTLPTFSYGGGTIYGLTNYPQRMSKTMADPTTDTWTPADTLDDVLHMKLMSQQAFHYGPWMMLHSTDWDRYLDGDFSAAKGTITLRDRLAMTKGIEDWLTVDYLPNYTMMMVQKTKEVVREVIGMDFTTVQWTGQAGFEEHFKIMCMMTPQLRADQNNRTGIVHGHL